MTSKQEDDEDHHGRILANDDAHIAEEVYKPSSFEHQKTASLSSSEVHEEEYQYQSAEEPIEYAGYGYEYNEAVETIDYRGRRMTDYDTRVVPPSLPAQPEPEDNRPSCLLVFCTILLILELGAAMIAVVYYDDLIECCGESFISASDSVTATWNRALHGIAIGYLTWVIVEFPIIALTKEPVFLFNPMIGFLLAIHMMYLTNVLNAYIIFGLECAAMLGQSFILMKLNRNAELCIHAIFNFTLCGLVTYLIIEMTRQGGYCIVDGELETVFKISTCDIGCFSDETCNICASNTTSCFIKFNEEDEISFDLWSQKDKVAAMFSMDDSP
mmetsp:Transcript_29608/g.49113  ORF Transcript_29608/g.49113 Transcript_29608/m.49113 type:complete len:328 (+) Transcript_29608:231-1214(+)